MRLTEHLEKLRHFYSVSQYRSMNEAAELTGISQAGLSKSVSSLEAILGVDLFIRSHSGLTLTKAGALVLESTRKIFGEVDGLETQLRMFNAADAPKILRIGMYDSIAVYLFAEFQSYLSATYRDLRIELLVDTSSNLAKLIKSGQADLVIGVNLKPLDEKEKDFFLLFDDDYSFFSSPKVTDSEFKLPLIIHPNATDANGSTLEALLSRTIKKRGAHRVFNFETISTLTSQGIGIGVLPTQVAKPLILRKLLVNCEIAQAKKLFGRHNIGFLASRNLLRDHKSFTDDLYRLGRKWTKT